VAEETKKDRGVSEDCAEACPRGLTPAGTGYRPPLTVLVTVSGDAPPKIGRNRGDFLYTANGLKGEVAVTVAFICGILASGLAHG